MNMLTPQEIKALRKALGWTLADMASRLKVSEGAVRLWESGERHPRWDTMTELNKLQKQTANGKKVTA